MEENILKSIKDLLGIYEDDSAFDNDVLTNINAVFSTLYQLGVGSESHYVVLTGDETWEEVFAEKELIDFIKLYTYMKVRVIFDPPTNSSILQALNEQIKETEYRILLQADPSDYFNSNYIYGSNSGIVFKKVERLPDIGEPNIIYLVPNGGSGDNIYDEFFWSDEDSKFELLGTIETNEDGDSPITDEEIDSLF